MPNILIVEDTQWDYEIIYEFLTTKGYDCFPKKEVFTNFITSIQNHLDPQVPAIVQQGTTNSLQTILKNLSPQLIILDVKLLPRDGDRSGLIFLEFLRNIYPYVPILVLTIHSFDDVISVFQKVGGTANYFLNKVLEGETFGSNSELTKVLGPDFLAKRLHPVIVMLLYWYEISISHKDILDLINSKHDELCLLLNTNFGLLRDDIKEIADDLECLKKHTDVLLRLAQYNIGSDDKKAGELVDNFIKEFSLITTVPKISENKPRMIDSLKKARDGFKEHIIKKEIVAKDIAELLTETFREIIGAEENESIIKAGLFSICKAVGRTWKFYKTGEF